jgi:hypothetical protein
MNDADHNSGETKIKTINGIRCLIEPNEVGFIDISIEHPDGIPFGRPDIKLYHEWIVRGALNEQDAIRLARAIIEAKRAGKIIVHDAEGWVIAITDPTQEGEEWKA